MTDNPKPRPPKPAATPQKSEDYKRVHKRHEPKKATASVKSEKPRVVKTQNRTARKTPVTKPFAAQEERLSYSPFASNAGLQSLRAQMNSESSSATKE